MTIFFLYSADSPNSGVNMKRIDGLDTLIYADRLVQRRAYVFPRTEKITFWGGHDFCECEVAKPGSDEKYLFDYR